MTDLKQTNFMKENSTHLLACLLSLVFLTVQASPNNSNTDWFKEARTGVFMHFLPADPQGLARVKDFDAEALARQLEAMGAKYLVLTLGQNSGFFNSPNAAYDRVTGSAAGERCSGARSASRSLPRPAIPGHPVDAVFALPSAKPGCTGAEGLWVAPGQSGPAARSGVCPEVGRGDPGMV